LISGGAKNLDPTAPALPSFNDASRANLFPFALMCAGWITPLLKFWGLVWGVARPSDYSGGDVAPHAGLFLAACAAGVATWWLPRSWYRIRPFEASGRIYEYAGVRHFRKIVPNGDWVNAWRRRRDPSFRVVPNVRAAEELRRRTIVGEKGHIVLLCLGAGSALFAWSIGWHAWAIYLGAANVLANLYPVLLQRYTRARIYRLASRKALNPR